MNSRSPYITVCPHKNGGKMSSRAIVKYLNEKFPGKSKDFVTERIMSRTKKNPISTHIIRYALDTGFINDYLEDHPCVMIFGPERSPPGQAVRNLKTILGSSDVLFITYEKGCK